MLASLPLRLCGTETIQSRRPIRFGVPFVQGEFLCGSGVQILNSQREVLPSQSQPFAAWPDGSVRWLAVDAILPADTSPDASFRVAVTPNGEPDALRALETVQGTDSTWQFKPGGPLLSCCHASGSQGTAWQFDFADAEGNTPAFQLQRRLVEECGPVQVTVCEEGTVTGHPQLFWRARITCYRELNLTKIRVTLRNTRRAQHPGGLWDLGDAGSTFFRRFGLRGTCEGRNRIWMQSHPSTAFEEYSGNSLTLRQTSSGGENWNSPNHLGRNGKLTVETKAGHILRDASTETYPQLLPTLALAEEHDLLHITVPEFWQRFPNELTWTKGREYFVCFFPEQEALHELQGGEQTTQEVWFAWNRAQPTAHAPLAWVHTPLTATIDPQAITKTQAFVWFPETWPNACQEQELENYLGKIVHGEHSVFAKREVIDEYGWRNYGDLYADHENRGNPEPQPRISHYNNQYDVLLGLLWHGLRSNQGEWFELATALAKHVIDIDLYHTQEDKPAYNGGMFWHTDHYHDAATSTHRCYSRRNQTPGLPYGGGPSCEHNYPTGLLLAHYLWADPEAAEAVKQLADWVIQMEEGRGSVWSLFDSDPTGAASSTFSPDFIGPGRGAGHSINALLDGFLLTNQARYLEAAEALIRRTIHPEDDIDSLDLLNVEARWSYTVYLNILGRYLEVKRHYHQMDTMFTYAQHALCKYADWVATHERFYLDHPEQLEFPTETWAAQEFRKANLLRLACYYAPHQFAHSLDHWKQRADAISHKAWKQLLAFDSCLVTRAMAIVMTEGWKDFSLAHTTHEKPDFPETIVPFPAKERFVPLKPRLKQKLTSPTGWLEMAVMFPYRAMRWAVHSRVSSESSLDFSPQWTEDHTAKISSAR